MATMKQDNNTSSSAISSRETLEEFREIFQLIDRDKGGTITEAELGELLKIIGIDSSQEEVGLMMRQVDKDHSGEIDFEEFVMLMTRRVSPNYTSSQIKFAFKVFQDVNGSPSGKVNVDTLVQYLTMHSSDELNTERVRKLVSQMDSDPEGIVDYIEYVDMMMHW